MLNHLALFGKRGFWIVFPVWIFVIYNIKHLFGAHYTQDSYTFYLLGKNIIEHFAYASPAIRDFYLDPAGGFLSRSHPPLFPLLVGITDFFLQEGIAAGSVINLFITMLALYAWFLVSKRISHYLFFIPFLIPIAYSIIPPTALWIDAVVGRSAAFTLPLLLMVLYFLLAPSLFTDNKTSVFVGIFMGLLTLTRFDTIPFCFALPAIIYFTTKLSIKKTMLMYVALLLTMVPWAIRNFIVFGSFLASDNALTASSTLSGILQLHFFEHAIPSVADDPKLWATKRIASLKYNYWFLYSLLTSVNTWIPVNPFLATAVRIIAFLSLPGLIFSFIHRKENNPLWIYFIVSLTWCVLNVACISLTSYGRDPRYYIVSSFLIMGGGALFIAAVIQHLLARKYKPSLPIIEKTGSSTMMMELLVCLMAVVITVHLYSQKIYHNTLDHFWAWSQHIENTPIKQGDLVAAQEAEIVSYHTGWNTIYLPMNAPRSSTSAPDMGNDHNDQVWRNYRAWLKHWKPDYLLVDLYDFYNPLASYPRATALTILDTIILLKINLDEASLTEKDAIENTRLRELWKNQIFSKIPERTIFYSDNFSFKNGIALHWDGFTVPNTPDNYQKFAKGRVVILPNGEHRLISEVLYDRYYLNIKVMGGAVSTKFSDLPDRFETIEGDPLKPFFATNDKWVRGVSKEWAGFYVKNTTEHQQQYTVGAIVRLSTGEERTITKVTKEPSIILVHLSGTLIDGYKVGTPNHFTVRNK